MTEAAAASSRLERLVEFAPAKVNLYLHVTGRRPDGYHLLDSLIVFAAIGDNLEFDPSPALHLAINGPHAASLGVGPGNLVVKAAQLLADAAGSAGKGATITLDKRLPVSAGIGGGSADAAATLRGLSRLWRLDDPFPRIAGLAGRLGADVPVCLAGKPAVVGGIGEILTPAPPLPPFWLLLVNPGFGLATADVFRARAGAFSVADPLTAPPADAAALAAALASRRNDLTEAAIDLVPEIRLVLSKIADQPGCLIARMSGSGATCFGLFAEERPARQAAGSLAGANPRWWVAAAPNLA